MTRPDAARFFDLPLEVRNLIYEHIFCGTYPSGRSKEVLLSISYSWRGYKCALQQRRDYKHLFISRRFYDEALPIFARGSTLRWSNPAGKDFNLNEMPSSRRKAFFFKDVIPRIPCARTVISANDPLPKRAVTQGTIEKMAALTNIDVEVTEPWYWIGSGNYLLSCDQMDWYGRSDVRTLSALDVHSMTLSPYRNEDAAELQVALLNCITLQRIAAAHYGQLDQIKGRMVNATMTVYVRLVCASSDLVQLMLEVKYDAKTLEIKSLQNINLFGVH